MPDEDYEITCFERKLIIDFSKRKEHIKGLIKLVNNFKNNCDRSFYHQIFEGYVSAERELTEKELDTEESRFYLDLEEDIEQLKRQANELPISEIRTQIFKILDQIQTKEKIEKSKKIDKFIKSLLRKLQEIIRVEKANLERGIVILNSIDSKEFKDCNQEIKLLVSNIILIQENIDEEEKEIIGPIRELLKQQVRQISKRDILELDLEQLKLELRSLTPLQAKILLERIDNILRKNKLIPIVDQKTETFVTKLLGLIRARRERKEIEKATLGEQRIRQEMTLARIDPLSQLNNKQAFLEDKIGFIKLKAREGGRLSVIIIDIDFFKKINDKFGHHIGDVVITAIGSAIKQHIRRGQDKAYRYGGEEFVVIFTDNNIDKVKLKNIVENIRIGITKHIQDLKKSNNDIKRLGERKVTASVGAVVYVFNKKNNINDANARKVFDNIFKKADGLVFNAKRNGRNNSQIEEVSDE